jgi:uncharacterized iron-regulated membrane protein
VKLLSAIHRWAGGFIGLLLALLGLTGAILVWEGEWIAVPGAGDPLVEDVGRIAAIVEDAAARGNLSRITFATEEIAVHQLTYADGSGAYVRQDGTVVDSWASQWERPELWLFDLHHHLFAGHTGETITGIAGIAGLLFVVTGIVLWWRSRRAFRLRLWPKRLAPGPIVAQHRDIGIVAAPFLLLSLTTGVLMLFEPLRASVLGEEVRPRAEITQPVRARSSGEMLVIAKALFSSAELRRVSFGRELDDPITVRMRQQAEWTPNGRTQLSFDARTGELLSVENPLLGNGAAAAAEKLYPLHSAKVGGVALKIAMTVSGLALALLGLLATWSFWSRQAAKRGRRRKFNRAAISPRSRRCHRARDSPPARPHGRAAAVLGTRRAGCRAARFRPE